MAPIGLALDRGDSVAGATRRVAPARRERRAWRSVWCAPAPISAVRPPNRSTATASTLRARAADLAERQVHSAQARLSAVVLTLLPVAALALLLATSQATRTAVLGSIRRRSAWARERR